MKKIKGLLLIVIVVTTFSANAQFKFGVGGGVNISKHTGADVYNSTNLIGFNTGLIFEIKLPTKVGFELNALYSVKGTNFDYGANNRDRASDITMTYIDFPLVVKFYILKVVSLQIGPQYSYLIRSTSGGSSNKFFINSNEVSGVFGLGLDVSKFHLSSRYNYGLTSTVDGGDIKNNMLTFTVGYWIK